jgi:hypothetical protein
MTYRDRRRARADRLRDWASKRHARSDAAFESARRLADAIPLGQPILVGHHSERRARRDAERIDHDMSKGVEHQRLADRMTSRAAEIERQADHAIYSDDADAIERLREPMHPIGVSSFPWPNIRLRSSRLPVAVQNHAGMNCRRN